MSDIRDRVQRGAKFLDEHGPEQWFNKINTDTLNLESCADCVLGQLYHSYRTGLEYLSIDGIDDESRYNFGFTLDMLPGRDSVFDWDLLTAEWKKHIYQRQSGARV